ncbi:chromosomal serine/threonine-protein kinase JIL-1 [Stomoxys calcitrans]|uniref:chromosomal serine/threonine-protein kinase JIL-1 n=1 Tax=Stomoxys calcitrans TaxID=35570 RepID=UPI0027E2F90B|nr:chromosomal serine/threonine-protein kinase JIL-1 [Stomoxys calcitrans]XP_013115060.2 chromosomal serine/threonine-protein kinase JIL-1 [Stomoxys calcitrans]XP_013115063.2 chromosomal serine/threonine-protein kinase JIL-1 [Stomoxys calcitrans]
MSRYHNSVNKTSTSYNYPSNCKKMSNRRQIDHESGYYEDVNEDPYNYGGGSGGQIGKRTRQRSNDVAASKYTKKQKVNNSHHTSGGQEKQQKHSSTSSTSSTSSRNVNDQIKELRYIPEYNYNNNNNKMYDNNHMEQNKISSYHSQNSSSYAQKSKSHANATNHNNNNVKNIPKTKSANKMSASSSANNNNNNNVYGSSSTQNHHKNPKITQNYCNSEEIVEIPDSEGEEIVDNKDNMATSSSKSYKMKNGSVNSVTSPKIAGCGVPTYVVSGSSSGSNSNHSNHNYGAEQQASSSKTTTNGGASKSHNDSNKKAGGTGDNGQNNSSNDLERLQREIEEVTQVYTKYVVKDDEQVNLSHFQLIRVLGTGAYGKVFLVRKIDGSDKGQLYAMKVLKKDTVVQKKKTAEHTTTERQVLEAIQQSPFLVGLHYAFQTDSKLYLVLDYVSGGELFTHLYKAEHFPESTVRVYIAEVVLALEHLHKLGIIYRDIKLENILLDGQGHIVLADFGLSKIFGPNSDHRAHSFCGTLEYMAPEIIRAGPNGHDLAVDWWSVGVLTYELLTGASPFTVVEQQNSQSDISRRIQKVDPVLPPTLGENVKDFILKMLHKDPKKRLGGNSRNAAEIKNHPFFKGINWNELKSKRRKAPFKPALASEDDTQNFSEEFTKQPVIDSPAPVPSNTHRLFRGYSYVAPQHRTPEVEIPPNSYLEYCNKAALDTFPAPDKNLELRELRSNGAFGKCFVGWDETCGGKVAVKIVPLNHYRPSEVDALISCGQDGHKYIAQYIGTYRKDSDMWIVQEFVPGCELSDYIYQHDEGLDELSCLNIITQMMDAVQHIHKRQFIHGDLKPENVLFTADDMGEIKLVDFGAACYHGDMESWSDKPRYTIDYAPPELLEEAEFGTYSEAVDIWCLGATLFTMYMGHTPFRRGRGDREVSLDTLKQRILSESFYTESSRWQQASPELRNLIMGCLEKDVAKRLTLLQILEHSWFHVQFDDNIEVIGELISEADEIKPENDVESTENEEFEAEKAAISVQVYDAAQQLVFVEEATALKVEAVENDNAYFTNKNDGDDGNYISCIDNKENEIGESQINLVKEENVEALSQNTRLALIAEEDERTCGMGKSISSEKEKSISKIDVLISIADTAAAQERDAITKSTSKSFQVAANHISSDPEDFKGFDENTPPLESQLGTLNRFITSTRRCKRAYMEDPKRLKSSPPTVNVHRTRNSARNVQQPLAPKPLDDKTNITPVNDVMSTLDSKSITISQRSRRPQTLASSAMKKKNVAAAQKTVEAIVQDNVDDFMGYTDLERKEETARFKSSWRIFNQMIHNTQMTLKYFNVDKRGYHKNSANVNAERQSVSKEQQIKAEPMMSTTKPNSPTPPVPASCNENIFQAGRRQPARITRCQRARYVFE